MATLYFFAMMFAPFLISLTRVTVDIGSNLLMYIVLNKA